MDNQSKKWFYESSPLSSSHHFLKTSIRKTETNLTRRAIPITSGKIISDQNFGFWLALFLPHHYRLIAGQPIHIFPYRPPIEDRATIYSKLNDIRAIETE